MPLQTTRAPFLGCALILNACAVLSHLEKYPVIGSMDEYMTLYFIGWSIKLFVCFICFMQFKLDM